MKLILNLYRTLTAGLDGKGYNGNFIVDGIIDAYQFTFKIQHKWLEKYWNLC